MTYLLIFSYTIELNCKYPLYTALLLSCAMKDPTGGNVIMMNNLNILDNHKSWWYKVMFYTPTKVQDDTVKLRKYTVLL